MIKNKVKKFTKKDEKFLLKHVKNFEKIIKKYQTP